MQYKWQKLLDLILIITILTLGIVEITNSSQATNNLLHPTSLAAPTSNQKSLTNPKNLLQSHPQKVQQNINLLNKSNLLRSVTEIPSITYANGYSGFTLKGKSGFDQTSYVNLNWSNLASLSGGYSVQRSEDPDNSNSWQNIASNYGKTIHILNVYPNGGNYLKNWMNITPSGQTQTVSRGLIDVTPVSLADFNNHPNTNQLNGNPYDCIFFGSADSNGDGNAGGDLSASAKQATETFANTGRSVTFGHDTLLTINGNHPNFASFIYKLGLRMFQSNLGDDRLGSTTVELTPNFMHGSLAQYPNNLLAYNPSNRFKIGASHTSNQFYEYNSGAQRWMDFVPLTNSDPHYHILGQYGTTDKHYINSNNQGTLNSNGAVADNNWYLVTKNNYAAIQTGHSTGSCSTEEAMIIANMLYYTSTLNTGTTGEDRTAKDTAAPDPPTIDNITPTINDTVTASFKSLDNATNYYYRVKGNTGNTERVSSEIQQPIKSDIKGYIYQINSNANTTITPNKDSTGNIDSSNNANFVSVANPADKAAVNNIDRFSDQYLHVVAIDNANNVSTISTRKISSLIAKNPQFVYKVFDDTNYNGILDSSENINNNQSITLFYHKQDGSYLPILSPFNPVGNGAWVFTNYLQINSTVQVGIETDTSGFKGLMPTSGSDLQEGPPVTINSHHYVLSKPIVMSNTNQNINLGLAKQLHFISFNSLPTIDFGGSDNPILYQNAKTLINNKTTNTDNELQINDQRGSKSNLSSYFIPYQVTVTLSTFKNDKNIAGLQQAQLLFQERGNMQPITISPNGSEYELYHSGTNVLNGINIRYYLDSAGRPQIKLRVPPVGSGNDIKAGKYTSTITYTIKNVP